MVNVIRRKKNHQSQQRQNVQMSVFSFINQFVQEATMSTDNLVTHALWACIIAKMIEVSSRFLVLVLELFAVVIFILISIAFLNFFIVLLSAEFTVVDNKFCEEPYCLDLKLPICTFNGQNYMRFKSRCDLQIYNCKFNTSCVNNEWQLFQIRARFQLNYFLFFRILRDLKNQSVWWKRWSRWL